MYKAIIIKLLLLVFIATNAQTEKLPTALKNHAAVYKDELDKYFYNASVYFINFNDKLATVEIKKAIEFINIEISQSDERAKIVLDPIIADLDKLVIDLGLNNLQNIYPLKSSFAKAHHKLARFYCNKAISLYNSNSIYGSILYLNAASSYLVYGAKWAGFEPKKGMRSTRVAINNATLAIHNREEIILKDYKKLLDYIDSEIKRFGNLINL
ncbi:hypothetical protein ACFLTE_04820 [Bacteroidota bacterium]